MHFDERVYINLEKHHVIQNGMKFDLNVWLESMTNDEIIENGGNKKLRFCYFCLFCYVWFATGILHLLTCIMIIRNRMESADCSVLRQSIVQNNWLLNDGILYYFKKKKRKKWNLSFEVLCTFSFASGNECEEFN